MFKVPPSTSQFHNFWDTASYVQCELWLVRCWLTNILNGFVPSLGFGMSTNKRLPLCFIIMVPQLNYLLGYIMGFRAIIFGADLDDEDSGEDDRGAKCWYTQRRMRVQMGEDGCRWLHRHDVRSRLPRRSPAQDAVLTRSYRMGQDVIGGLLLHYSVGSRWSSSRPIGLGRYDDHSRPLMSLCLAFQIAETCMIAY